MIHIAGTKRINLKFRNQTDIKRTLSKVGNMVANGEMDTRRANAITIICNAILSSIRVDEQQHKIEELAKILDENDIKSL